MTNVQANFWDRLAAGAQEHILSTVKTRYFPEVWYALENWFQTVKKKEVLEVGYGIGLIGEALAKSGWDVTIADSSATALSELKERFGKQNLKATFVSSDLQKLPFESQSQEAIVAINSLEGVHDPRLTLREISRVLKPSGRAAIVIFNRHGPWGLPFIRSQLRFPQQRPAGQLFTKREFVKLLLASRLAPAKVLERGAYLPFPLPFNIQVPITGAYVALIKNNMGSKKQGRNSKRNLLRPPRK